MLVSMFISGFNNTARQHEALSSYQQINVIETCKMPTLTTMDNLF